MEKEGNGSCHEVIRALPLQLHQEDPSPGSPHTLPFVGVPGARCTHTGELSRMDKGLLAETPRCGHAVCFLQVELVCPNKPELEVSSWR